MVTRKKTLVLGWVVGLVVVSAAGTGLYWWKRVAGPVRMVEERVRGALKDPDSALFKEVVYRADKDVGCGVVNAKNSMGGYVGFTEFVAFADGDVRFEPPLAPESASAQVRLEAVQKQLGFLEIVKANCP